MKELNVDHNEDEHFQTTEITFSLLSNFPCNIILIHQNWWMSNALLTYSPLLFMGKTENTENSSLFYSMYALWFQLYDMNDRNISLQGIKDLVFMINHYGEQMDYKSEMNKGCFRFTLNQADCF